MTKSEKEQFIQQYETIHTSLMRFCTVKSRGIMDPKDLAHDVLLVGLENYHKLKNKQALLPYLFTTANRICIDKIRRKKFAGTYKEEKAEQIIDEVNNVDTQADIGILYTALDKLPPLQKEALILFEISDLPIKEVMVIQNAKESTVKQRLKRGRNKLAELLQEKKKKRAILVPSILLSSNVFSMSQLKPYFDAVKSLPLPLSEGDAIAAISNYASACATSTTLSTLKNSTSILRESIIGSLVIGGVITTSIIMATPSAPPQTNWTTETNVANIEQFNNTEKEKNIITTTHKQPDNAITIIDYTKIDTTQTKPTDSDTLTQPTISNPSISLLSPNETNTNVSVNNTGDNTYSTENVQLISFNNIGDNVKLKTWTKNEIQIIPNHTIETKKPEEEKSILEKIKCTVKVEDNIMKITNPKCGTKEMHFGFGLKKNTIILDNGEKIKYKTLELNYTIMIPETIDLEIIGTYKNLKIPSLTKDLTLKLTNTNVKLGDVSGKAAIKLTYSKANLGNFSTLDLTLFESNTNLKSVESMTLSAKYSDITADAVSLENINLFESKLSTKSIKNNLNGTLRYSKVIVENNGINQSNLILFESTINIPSIHELRGESRYSKVICNTITNVNMRITFESTFNIGTIDKLEVESSKYTDYEIDKVTTFATINSFEDKLIIKTAGLADMSFKGKYSSYNITLSRPSDYRFNFISNYCSLDYSNLNLTIEQQEKAQSKNNIKGFFENGNSTQSGNLSFDCFEGNVKLN